MKRESFPVSRKFYSDITERINTSLAGCPASAEEALHLVRCHICGEKAVSANCMAMLAFNMIRPEIDRAMERSRRARERASLRKKAIESDKETCQKEGKTETSDVPQPTIRLSRRERRAAERLKRKLAGLRKDVSFPTSYAKSQKTVRTISEPSPCMHS